MLVATTNGASIFSDPNELILTNILTSSNTNNLTISDATMTLFNTASGLILFGNSEEGLGVLDTNSNMFTNLGLEQ